jgi:hypothetical protein
MEALDLSDLEPLAYSFKHKGKEYVLREASEAVAAAYYSAQIRLRKVGPDGKAEASEEWPMIRALLVSGSTFELMTDGKEKPVDCRMWPTRLVERLFLKAREISELESGKETVKHLEERLAKVREVETAAKNARPATGTTSS